MKKISQGDIALFLSVAALVFLGALMILSVGFFKRPASPYGFFLKHILWTIVGLGGMYAAVHVKPGFLRKNARILYAVSAAALAGVLLFGKEINGARRWFDLGVTTFQPSEATKIAVIIFLADYLDRKKSRLSEPGGFAFPALLAALPAGLILIQPDLGGAIVVALVALSMFYLAGVKFRYLAVSFLLCGFFAAAAVVATPYRMARVKNYVAAMSLDSVGAKIPTSPSDVKGQQSAALAALGRGGWLGVGPGLSQLKKSYLPEPHTDFVFSVLGEELGYLGALSVLGLFFLLFWRGVKIAVSSGDMFVSLAAAGITLYFSAQALFHVGVNCAVLPTKGLTLPFISFGGSSLIISLTAAGLLINFSSRAASSAGRLR